VRPIRFSFQPEEADFVELVGIADLHFGHAQHETYKAMKHRDYIAASPDRYCIDLGDPMENTLKSSVGNVYEQTMRPRDQRDYAYDWYEHIGGKLLGVCAANHGERSMREVDFSPEEWLADKFGAEYIHYQAVLAITVGDSRKGNQYLVHVHHGAGGAMTPGGIILKMQKSVLKMQGCHAYLRGHNHSWVHHVQTAFIPDPRHGKIREMSQHLINSGGFLGYDESYSDAKDYPLPTPGQVSLKMYLNEPRMEVTQLIY
jgi:hypothetical protein